MSRILVKILKKLTSQHTTSKSQRMLKSMQVNKTSKKGPSCHVLSGCSYDRGNEKKPGNHIK